MLTARWSEPSPTVAAESRPRGWEALAVMSREGKIADLKFGRTGLWLLRLSQIGIQAKQKLNTDVINQALDGRLRSLGTEGEHRPRKAGNARALRGII